MSLSFLAKTIAATLIILCVCACPSTSAQSRRRAPVRTPQIKYTLTIFVDEGRDELNGHAFVLLSDGKNNIYRGFYSQEWREVGGRPLFAIVGLGGGEIRDDVHHPWSVKKSYDITKEGFDSALRGIEELREQGESWWINNHCGDFAEAIAKVAGVSLDLQWNVEGRNRPAVFGEYLREHGGIVNPQVPESKQGQRSQAKLSANEQGNATDDDKMDMMGFMMEGEDYFKNRLGAWERFKQRHPDYEDLTWSALEKQELIDSTRRLLKEYHHDCIMAQANKLDDKVVKEICDRETKLTQKLSQLLGK